jgi:hypothetical protein
VEGYLTATASEDWALVLEVCERASSSESNAKEAVKALRREFKSVSPAGPFGFDGLITPIHRYAEPPAQLSAARVGHPPPSATIAQSKKGYLSGSFGL